MIAGEIRSHGPAAFPNWVPPDVRHYLIHTEDGMSIRALARAVGCHASTILRQVRRNENRRDDPLLDTAFDRLATSARIRPSHSSKETLSMTALPNPEDVPSQDTIDMEARRILRRLCEPDAVLAIAPQMEKAVVVRELADGRTIRTAVLDRIIAEAFVVQDWIELSGSGKVARYAISQVGRAALKRLLSEHEHQRQGLEEAPAIFADQHRAFDTRTVHQGDARPNRRIRYNTLESPLQAIARRKDKSGAPFLATDLVAAGERLREDFELAQLGPRIAQNWDRFLTGGGRGGFAPSGRSSGPEAARDRVVDALDDLGPGLGDVALRVCCFLEGMEQVEKRMGWAARSGKIVLKIALQRLARHYQGQGAKAAMIG